MPPASVLLADGDPGRTMVESETFYLQAALRLAAAGETYEKAPFETTVADLTGASALPVLDNYRAVVLANVQTLSATDARRLGSFVERGGGLLVFTGDRVQKESARVLAEEGLAVGTIGGTVTATVDELPLRLDRWDAKHPIFRPFDDPEHGDLRRPSFTTITRIKPDTSARVLAWFRGDLPAVLERAHGRGKVVWFASSCDRGWGDWPRRRLYLPMVHQLLAYVCGLAEGGPVRHEPAVGVSAPGLREADGIVTIVDADPAESETAALHAAGVRRSVRFSPARAARTGGRCQADKKTVR